MNIPGIVFLVNKASLGIVYAGEVPSVWGNITGLSNIDYAILRDLEPTFGSDYKDLGFLTEEDARVQGIPADYILRMKVGAWEMKWSTLNEERFELIQAQRWRIDRHNDEAALGAVITEDILPVLQYCQAIRELPTVQPDPFNVVWPTAPHYHNP